MLWWCASITLNYKGCCGTGRNGCDHEDLSCEVHRGVTRNGCCHACSPRCCRYRSGQSSRGNLDGVGRDRQDESAPANGDAVFGEELTQTFHGAIDSLACGIVRRAERCTDFAKGFVLEVAEQDSG